MHLLLLFILAVFSFSVEIEGTAIGVITNPEWKGEYSFAQRVKAAGKNLGWDVTLLHSQSNLDSQEEFDWILTLTPDGVNQIANSKAPNYLVIFDPVHHYFAKDFHVDERFSAYYGYLKTFKDPLVIPLDKKQKIYPLPWYPTVQFRLYQRVNLKALFYFMGFWGNRLDDTRYKQLQFLLAQQSYAAFFGDPTCGSLYPVAYKGRIAFSSESIQKQIAHLGICLVLHSDTHIQHKIPSGRIFEAAASSAVIISDKNSFVEEHFGDAVLYVDQTASGEEMFRQIDAHMDWIATHKEEALQLARRSYDIFHENFVLEQQLLQFHEGHLSQLR